MIFIRYLTRIRGICIVSRQGITTCSSELSDCFRNEAAQETRRVETRGIPLERRNKDRDHHITAANLVHFNFCDFLRCQHTHWAHCTTHTGARELRTNGCSSFPYLDSRCCFLLSCVTDVRYINGLSGRSRSATQPAKLRRDSTFTPLNARYESRW